MNNEFDAALNECLDLLRTGVDIPTCLAHYPQYADRLRPLIKLAADVHAVVTPAPASAARLAGRQRMLEALAQRQARPSASAPAIAPTFVHRSAPASVRPVRPKMRRTQYSLRLAFAVLLIAIVAASGTVAAAESSLPGDMLYPVKLAAQQTQIALTFDTAARSQLEEQSKAQQWQDVQAAQRAGRQATIELEGQLEQIEGNTWVVSGAKLTVEPGATLIGKPHIGAWVAIRGHLPGDGSLVATAMTVRNGSKLPPTVTAHPTAPSETPVPTRTPEPTETPKPTEVAQPTRVPEPTKEIKPTETPQPTLEVKPTKTPKPTDEPKPTKEPKPTDEPKPTKEPKPTNEPKPTKEPKPTNEPKPTKEPKEPKPTKKP